MQGYTVGREIELTAKEYELLKFLMINKGKVVTKNQIYRNVWQNEFVEDDNTVMVHISKLREKIEEDPKAPRHLKTIRGIGYRFDTAYYNLIMFKKNYPFTAVKGCFSPLSLRSNHDVCLPMIS